MLPQKAECKDATTCKSTEWQTADHTTTSDRTCKAVDVDLPYSCPPGVVGDSLYAPVQPCNLVGPAELMGKRCHGFVAGDGVDGVRFLAPDAQLAQAHGTEVYWPPVEFFAVVAPAHETFVVDTMPDAEQVASLVGQHLRTPA